MYCPRCQDEFRAGFTRCASCDVDLVERLLAAAPAGPPRVVAPVAPVRLMDCCGFLALEEARAVRERLRERGIRCEIVLRDATDEDPSQPGQEEWWLRVDPARGKEVAALLEDVEPVDPVQAEEAVEGGAETFECGDCGHSVAEDQATCPSCGAPFED